jgi:hypothetical protein
MDAQVATCIIFASFWESVSSAQFSLDLREDIPAVGGRRRQGCSSLEDFFTFGI